MRPRIVIRLNSDPQGTVHWVLLDAVGAIESHPESGSLEAAATAARGRQVIALAPTVDVALLSAHIPTQSRQRTQRAVPYALEDQLADDVDRLHFALGQRDGSGRLAVAVVTLEQMGGWLDELTAVGLDVEQIYPEALALPLEDNAWTVLIEGDAFAVRTARQGGFAGDLDNLPVLLQAALTEAGDAAPPKLLVYSAEAPVALVEPALEIENRPLDNTTALLATALREKDAIGLRSGPFVRRRSGGGGLINWRRWQLAASLLIAWALISTGVALLQQWRLERQSAQLQAEIEQVYRSAFPGATRVVNPRTQMESRLQTLRKQGGDSGLLTLLQKIGPILTAEPGVELTALSYRNGDLDIELYARTLQSLDQLTQRLGGLGGIKVELRGATTQGERVQGRLRIGAS